MKKILAMLLALCMIFALAACGETAPAETKPAEEPAAEAPAEEPAAAPEEPAEETAPEAPAEEAPAEEAPAEEIPADAAYKLGLGVSLNMNSSKTGNAQVDATTAAVILDEQGKIVAVKIDVAQNKMDITDGAVDTEKEFLTKLEKGDAYGMVASGLATMEWYEQAANFEQFVIGKTVEEVEAIETREDGEHLLAVDEELYAGCTISIGEFKEAVVKACNDEQAATFAGAGGFSLGLAVISNAKDSVAATAEEDGVVKMYSEFAAVVIDDEGVIQAAVTDATQPQIKIDAAGEIVETTFKGTKRELKEEYGMSKIGAVEWYLQAAAFEEYAVGKTAEELRATETREDGEHIVAADETLYASVSISIEGMINVVAKAADNAAA